MNTLNNGRPGLIQTPHKRQTYGKHASRPGKTNSPFFTDPQPSRYREPDSSIDLTGQDNSERPGKRLKTSHSSPVYRPSHSSSREYSQDPIETSEGEEFTPLDSKRAGAAADPDCVKWQKSSSRMSNALPKSDSHEIRHDTAERSRHSKSAVNLSSPGSRPMRTRQSFTMLDDAERNSDHFKPDPPSEKELQAKQRNPHAKKSLRSGEHSSSPIAIEDHQPGMHSSMESYPVSRPRNEEPLPDPYKSTARLTPSTRRNKAQQAHSMVDCSINEDPDHNLRGAIPFEASSAHIQRIGRDSRKDLEEGSKSASLRQPSQPTTSPHFSTARSTGRLCPTRKISPPQQDKPDPALSASKPRIRDGMRDTSTTSIRPERKRPAMRRTSSLDELSGPSNVVSPPKQLASKRKTIVQQPSLEIVTSATPLESVVFRHQQTSEEKPAEVSDSEPEEVSSPQIRVRQPRQQQETKSSQLTQNGTSLIEDMRPSVVETVKHRQPSPILGEDSELEVEEKTSNIPDAASQTEPVARDGLSDSTARPNHTSNAEEVDHSTFVSEAKRSVSPDGKYKPIQDEINNQDIVELKSTSQVEAPPDILEHREQRRSSSRRKRRSSPAQPRPDIEENQRPTRSSRRLKEKPLDPQADSARKRQSKPWATPLTWPFDGQKRATVESDDVARLAEGEFLNDSLISFELLRLELEHTDLADKVYIFNSHFYEALTGASSGRSVFNYDSVKKWTRKVDLFSFPYIVVPVCLSSHWFVFIICNADTLVGSIDLSGDEPEPRLLSQTSQPDQLLFDDVPKQVSSPTKVDDLDMEKMTLDKSDSLVPPQSSAQQNLSQSTFTVPESDGELPERKAPPKRRGGGKRTSPRAPVIIQLDSMGLTHTAEVRNLKKYLIEEAKVKKDRTVDIRDIVSVSAKGIPTQTNLYDCGVYIIGYVENFFRNPQRFVEKVCSREMDENNDFDGFDPSKARTDFRKRLRSLHNEQVRKKKLSKQEKRGGAGEFDGSSSPAKRARIHRADVTPSTSVATQQVVSAGATKEASTVKQDRNRGHERRADRSSPAEDRAKRQDDQPGYAGWLGGIESAAEAAEAGTARIVHLTDASRDE